MTLITNETNTFPRDSDCYHCGKLIENPPYIFWQGYGEGIAFHPECCQYVAINLLSDFLAYQPPMAEKEVCSGQV